MSEHDEQKIVVNYIFMQYPDVLFWSTPNGAHLAGSKRVRAMQVNKLKDEGLLPGVSDLTIFEPRGGYSCMFLEMKDTDGHKPSENQEHFLRQVEQRGAFGAVAYGADQAIELIDLYLNGGIAAEKELTNDTEHDQT